MRALLIFQERSSPNFQNAALARSEYTRRSLAGIYGGIWRMQKLCTMEGGIKPALAVAVSATIVKMEY